MKVVYPVVLEKEASGGYLVNVPDFDRDTQGDSLADALDMAQDLIAILSVSYQDSAKELPTMTPLNQIEATGDEVKTLVSADLSRYRAKIDNRAVKKTLTIPSWLNVEAEAAHVNFSSVLQDALKERLSTTH
ncbi:MAG: type II toxin-antitoxin system HicB family antitoxin [Coriobacteriia bacterium]|nr:type II toxin-antitoxin system HicB family antitoxin [Coriobacteriia bacterium]